MQIRNLTIIAMLLLPTRLGAGPVIKEMVNYQTLDHQIRLSTLRSGNHDVSGINDYYFLAKIYGLSSTQEERKLDFASRKKISIDIGRIGAIQISALSHWDKKSSPPETKIKGETIRDLVAKAMKQFKVPEEDVAILIEVEMFEDNQRFVFLGSSQFIGKASYHLIPEMFPHKPITKDLALSITDDFGTYVSFLVSFKANASAEAAESSGGGE